MKKWIVIFIGIVLILSVFYFPEKNKSTQSTYVLPVSQLENIKQTKYLYYYGDYTTDPYELVGIINYSDSKLEILLYYDPSKFIGSKMDNTIKRPLPYFSPSIVERIKKFAEEQGYWSWTNQVYITPTICDNKSGFYYSDRVYKYSRLDMSVVIDGEEYKISPFTTCSFTVPPIVCNKTKIRRSLSFKVDLFYKAKYSDNWQKKTSSEISCFTIIDHLITPPPQSSFIVDKITPNSITIRTNTPNLSQYYKVEIYDKNSFMKLDKPITQDSTYTFTITELTPNTEYRVVCGDKEIFVTTPKEQETLDIIPLGTEKTSNSFVQVYKVTGENINQKIQLKHGDKVWNYEPQFDGKNYYVVFDGLETGDYEYTITVYNATEEKRYSNSFHIQNVENTSGIDLDVEPAKIDQNSFYLRFRVKGTDDYEAYFEYLNEDTFEVQEAEINHGVRYDDVYLKNLEEGDYSYNLIISTEEGTIEHKGTFTIRKEEQPTYIPPYTPQSEKKSIFPYLVVIIIIFLITYIFIKPKIINSKKRRR